jgi:ABC-type Fe3+/spermidine/putrescine transport system ATPase subunit
MGAIEACMAWISAIRDAMRRRYIVAPAAPGVDSWGHVAPCCAHATPTGGPTTASTASDDSAPHVELRGVRKAFGATVAVDDLTLEVARGSFTTVLGPSGCGKTTTLRLLAGFFEPDAGEVLIGGVRQNGVPPNRRNVSIVFQDYALFPHMSVVRNVGYGLRMRRVPVSERTRRVDRVLTFLGLEGLGERLPSELSGGQQQRVALGRSIVMEPAVLLMDEPLSNLDAALRQHVRAELKTIQRSLGITTLYVTHDQQEALTLSDQVAVMAEGRLRQVSDPWTLYHAPRDRFVASFVGDANVLSGRVVARDEDGLARVRLDGPDGAELVCRDPSSRGRPGAAVGVVVRPEWWQVEADADRSAPDEPSTLHGRVVDRAFQGATTRLSVALEGALGRVAVELPLEVPDAFPVGAPLRLRVSAARAVLVEAEA